MILPLFLWITRQKAARERRGGIGCGSDQDSVATPDRRGQGRAVADRIGATVRPLVPVTSRRTARSQDTGERLRKPANVS